MLLSVTIQRITVITVWTVITDTLFWIVSYFYYMGLKVFEHGNLCGTDFNSSDMLKVSVTFCAVPSNYHLQECVHCRNCRLPSCATNSRYFVGNYNQCSDDLGFYLRNKILQSKHLLKIDEKLKNITFWTVWRGSSTEIR